MPTTPPTTLMANPCSPKACSIMDAGMPMASSTSRSCFLSKSSMVNEAMMLKAATTRMKLKMANVAHFSARLVWVMNLCLSSRVRDWARLASSPNLSFNTAMTEPASSSWVHPVAALISNRDTCMGRSSRAWVSSSGMSR